jgi:hypothetical protein
MSEEEMYGCAVKLLGNSKEIIYYGDILKANE